MKSFKVRRVAVTVVCVLICYLLQCTVFSKLALASIKPNLLIILTAAFGFIRGPKDGMFIGFFSGLFIDIQFGNILGFYALLYLLIGYVNGMFHHTYYTEDFKLPVALIGASEFVYGLIIYIFLFMLRGEFNFLHYLSHIIIPDVIYTIVVTFALYPLIRFINDKLEAEEKRSAGKFVK